MTREVPMVGDRVWIPKIPGPAEAEVLNVYHGPLGWQVTVSYVFDGKPVEDSWLTVSLDRLVDPTAD